MQFYMSRGKNLSILQYRHANLNNYLHGPSYALGNHMLLLKLHDVVGKVQISSKDQLRKDINKCPPKYGYEEDAIKFYRNLLGEEIAKRKAR